MKRNLLIGCFAVITISSCKKGPLAQLLPYAEMPASTYYLKRSGDKTKERYDGGRMSECGYRFKSSKAGEITAFGLMLPKINQDYIVTLWNADAKSMIYQQAITAKDSTSFNYQNLNYLGNEFSVSIQADKEYVISVFLADTAGAGLPTRPCYFLMSGYEYPYGNGYVQMLDTRYGDSVIYHPSFPEHVHKKQNGTPDYLFGLVDISYTTTE